MGQLQKCELVTASRISTYTSSGCLPVYGKILSSSRDNIRVPRRSADFDILIVHFRLFTIHMTVL